MRKHNLVISVLLAIAVLFTALPPQIIHAATSAQHLAAATAPTFKAGTTLPRISLSGYAQPDAFWAEWYARWHGAYTVDVARLDATDVTTITTAQSYRMVRYAQANNIPVWVKPNRALQNVAFMWAQPDATWARDAQGARWPGYGTATGYTSRTPGCFSPMAPLSVYADAGTAEAVGVAAVAQFCTIEAIQHEGEQALNVPAFVSGNPAGIREIAKWGQDATCVAAFGTTISQAAYSTRRAAFYAAEAAALRAAAPDGALYLYYRGSHPDIRTTGGVEWRNYIGEWSDLRGVFTHGAPSIYYSAGETFTPPYDMLSRFTCVAGGHLAAGDKFIIPYVSGGWGPTLRANYDAYLGCLKAVAMTGAVSYICGDFDSSINTSADFATCPDWLKYRMVASHAQGWLSWLYADYWAGGDLLAGPNKHAWSKDQPAYEYPTGDAGARCLIRKKTGAADYLVLVWNTSGVDRYVSITMPVGTYRLYARACGTTYRITSTGVTLMDADYTNPSASLAAVAANTNRQPVAEQMRAYTKTGKPVSITLRAVDGDGNALTYSVVSAPANGTLTGTAPNLTYTPRAKFVGVDTFTYKANDGTADSNSAAVRVSVTTY